MDSSEFDVARWDHWLIVASFLGLAVYGLWLSWQWKCAARKRRRTAIARRLAMEVHGRQLSALSESSFVQDDRLVDDRLIDGRSAAREKVRFASSSSVQHLRRDLN